MTKKKLDKNPSTLEAKLEKCVSKSVHRSIITFEILRAFNDERGIENNGTGFLRCE